jgi:hypothetical protein
MTFPASRFALRVHAWLRRWLFVGLQWLIGVLALWYAAGVFWQVMTPAAPVAAPAFVSDPQEQAMRLAAQHVFGEATAASSSGGAAIVSNSSIVVRGVIAAQGRRKGVAIVSIDGQPPVTIAEGEDIRSGVRLEQVLSNQISINRQGVRETIPLSGTSPIKR